MSADFGSVVTGILVAREERRAARDASRESKRQAQVVEQQGRDDVAAERRLAAQDAARSRAQAGAAGVEAEGTPLFGLVQNLQESQLERSLILRGAKRRAAEIRQAGRSRAKSLRSSATTRFVGASLGAGGLVLSAGRNKFAEKDAGFQADVRRNAETGFAARRRSQSSTGSGQGTSILR